MGDFNREIGKKHNWRIPSWANYRFEELCIRIEDLPSDSEEAHAIRDEIRSLPNFPRNAREDDIIYREITTVR